MRLLLALVLVLASPFALAANPLAADIHGKVVDVHGQPLAGVEVVIHGLETGAIKVRRTNAKGRFYQSGLRADLHYTVTFRDPQGRVEPRSYGPGRVELGNNHRRNAVLVPTGMDAHTAFQITASTAVENRWITSWHFGGVPHPSTRNQP